MSGRTLVFSWEAGMTRFLAAIRLLLTLRCEQSTMIVSESLDRELSFVERWAVRLHCISCWSCRRFGKQIRQLREALRGYPDKTSDQHGLSPDAIARIKQAIEQTE